MDEKERLEEEKRQDELEKRNGVAWLKSRAATHLFFALGPLPILVITILYYTRTLEIEEKGFIAFLFLFALHLGSLIAYWNVWKAGYTKQPNKPDGANGLAGPSE